MPPSAKLSLLVFTLLLSSIVAATTIDYSQTLNFGRIIFLNHSTPQSIEIQPNGTITHTDRVTILSPGTPGRFDFDELVPNTLYNYNLILNGSPINQSGGPQSLNFSFTPSTGTFSTDIHGRASINIGGRFETQASSASSHSGGEFIQNFTIIINH